MLAACDSVVLVQDCDSLAWASGVCAGRDGIKVDKSIIATVNRDRNQRRILHGGLQRIAIDEFSAFKSSVSSECSSAVAQNPVSPVTGRGSKKRLLEPTNQ